MIKKNSTTSPMGSTIKSFMYAINKLNLFIIIINDYMRILLFIPINSI